MRQADHARLDRLAGDGNSEVGIDLASLFRVILNQLQDSPGAISPAVLAGPVKSAVSNHARVEHWYSDHGDDPWSALIDAALGQLESRKLAEQDQEGWRTGPAFVTGRRLVVVPRRPGKHDSVGVILYPAAEREARGEAEKRRMEITSMAASFREDGPGLRSLNTEHVEAIAQSMRDFGWRKEFPVLLDQHGRVLDGRHRRAAARLAGVEEPAPKTINVASDEEAVCLAILVNVQRGWTRAERSRIDSILQSIGMSMETIGRRIGTAAKRELITAALLEDATRSDRVIAEATGTSHHTVATVRVELESVGQIAQLTRRTGSDGKDYRSRQPSESDEVIENLLKAHPEMSNTAIAAEAGYSTNTKAGIPETRARLEASGEIPRYERRVGTDGTARSIVPPARQGAAPPADQSMAPLEQMAAAFRVMAPESQRQAAKVILRAMRPEDLAAVLAEIGASLPG